jgi:hypothetical protein
MLKNGLENLRSAILFCCRRDPDAPGFSTDGSLSDEKKNNLRHQFKNKIKLHSQHSIAINACKQHKHSCFKIKK